jgi:hypothetical protein
MSRKAFGRFDNNVLFLYPRHDSMIKKVERIKSVYVPQQKRFALRCSFQRWGAKYLALQRHLRQEIGVSGTRRPVVTLASEWR